MNAMQNFSHEFISLPNVGYENAYQFSLGGFYIPTTVQLQAIGKGLSLEWDFDMN